MGSGSSTANGSAASPPPACPLFYNHTPSAQHIPASTLPTRDTGGNVRRPQGGCAARVIALRHLPVVTAEAKKDAKEFFANVSKMRKAKSGDEAALVKIDEIEVQAKSIQNDPSLTPAVSSCFLINIAVDEQGRLAPLSTDGAAGLTDTTNVIDHVGDGDLSSECGSASASSQMHTTGRKGFNFDAANNNNNASGQASAGDAATSPPPASTAARKPPQLKVASAASEAQHRDMASLPSPTAARTPPPPSDTAVVQRLSQRPNGNGAHAAAAAAAVPPAPIIGAKVAPTIFAPPPAPVSGNDTDMEETDSNVQLSSSTRSLLVKDSRFRRGDGTENPPAAVGVAAASNNNNLGDPSTTRLRRQNPRIKLMQVPNRTRWFLFNDSRTHEAQVSVLFCYMKAAEAEKAGAAAKSDLKDGSGNTSILSPRKGTSGVGPEAGEMKVMCVPTPLSYAATAPKEVKKQLANSSSSSRSFVEVEPMDVASFVRALPTPAAGPQQDLLSRLEAKASKMAAVSLFIVLAPGVTVFLAEGEATGYMVSTHMVPFNAQTSMAVLGRMLTPELVLSGKQKAASLVRDCYRHKLIYLSHMNDRQGTGGDAAGTRGATASSPAPPRALAAVPPVHPGVAAEQRASAVPKTSSSTTNNPTAANAVTSGQISTSIKHTPLPPIRPLPKSSVQPVATGPLKAAGDAAAAPPIRPLPKSPVQLVAAGPLKAAGDAAAAPPTTHPQQRLSQRSPTAPPTSVEPVAEKGDGKDEQGGVPLRMKRIGSMLRNPTFGNHGDEDGEGDRSFHRDLPSCNSLAISF